MGVGDLLKKIFIESERSDFGAIELLYRWYGGKVYHAAYYVLNDRYLAEDIAQETFLTYEGFSGSQSLPISSIRSKW